MRGLSAAVRFRLATAMAILGGVVLLAGPVRLTGQWVDDCQHHFGWTHAELITSLALGAVAFFVGYEYKEDRVQIGQILGGFVAAGAVVMYVILTGCGCGN